MGLPDAHGWRGVRRIPESASPSAHRRKRCAEGLAITRGKATDRSLVIYHHGDRNCVSGVPFTWPSPAGEVGEQAAVSGAADGPQRSGLVAEAGQESLLPVHRGPVLGPAPGDHLGQRLLPGVGALQRVGVNQAVQLEAPEPG
jgi:hypothetical protein